MSWNLEEALSYYKKQGAPADQGALISLLREIQSENGGSIPVSVPTLLAKEYDIREALVLALIKRIPSLRLSNVHTLELCAGINCGKHRALADCAERLQKESGGKFTLKFVPCMRMCGKGPNIRWDGEVKNGASEELLYSLVEQSDKK